MPLWAAVDQFHEAIIAKIGAYFDWLREIDAKMPEDMQASVNVIYETPFTPGGPFVQVPTAIVSATVLYRGFAFRAATSGKEPERRGMKLGIQSMQTTPDPAAAIKRIVHNLTWYSKPEADLLPS